VSLAREGALRRAEGGAGGAVWPAMADAAAGRVHIERDGAIGWLVYDNPQRHNALTLPMLAAIPEAVAELEADDDVRVVVLRGAGDRAFVSGADIGQVSGGSGSPDPRRMFAAVGGESLLAVTKPVLAMLQGWCLGGGLLTALCADIRIAADDAVLGIPAAKLGAGYPYEGVAVLVHAVGAAHAAEVLLTGDRFDAATAMRMGLVHRVVPKADLEAEVRALAERVAANAPLTLTAAKLAIRAAAGGGHPEAVAAADEAVSRCWGSDDLVEGQQAFLAKRTPRFTGR
jgi:enoyl-CoA hydratase